MKKKSIYSLRRANQEDLTISLAAKSARLETLRDFYFTQRGSTAPTICHILFRCTLFFTVGDSYLENITTTAQQHEITLTGIKFEVKKYPSCHIDVSSIDFFSAIMHTFLNLKKLRTRRSKVIPTKIENRFSRSEFCGVPVATFQEKLFNLKVIGFGKKKQARQDF